MRKVVTNADSGSQNFRDRLTNTDTDLLSEHRRKTKPTLTCGLKIGGCDEDVEFGASRSSEQKAVGVNK